MFVPGYSRSVSFIQSEIIILLLYTISSQCQVIPWHKEPIKLQDLQQLVYLLLLVLSW